MHTRATPKSLQDGDYNKQNLEKSRSNIHNVIKIPFSFSTENSFVVLVCINKYTLSWKTRRTWITLLVEQN